MLTLIAAIARHSAIGRKGQLLWHIPADLKHFKQLTMGAPVVMGRATWESLPFRPLPGRQNIIITRNPDYKPLNAKGLPVTSRTLVITEINEALSYARRIADAAGKDAFIIGGGNIYAATLPHADAIEVTEIDAEAPDADTFFPEIKDDEWKIVRCDEPIIDNEGSTPPFRFVRYERRNNK